jgi:hypothetical protein
MQIIFSPLRGEIRVRVNCYPGTACHNKDKNTVEVTAIRSFCAIGDQGGAFPFLEKTCPETKSSVG